MDACSTCHDQAPTGNDLPILHEIRHALDRLIESGEPTIIDLRAMPMAPGEEARIESVLGHGEVDARIDALGPSEVRETAIAGVWLVTHYNAEEEILGKFIEITRLPSILESQTEDMRNGLAVLNGLLATDS